jgi:transcriptional regulator with XRE-family HTH domain
MPQPISDAARILGERVRDARIRFALSQDDIANLAGMNVSNYGKIERGLSNPTLHTIVRIASVLDTDPATFLHGLGAESLPAIDHPFTAKAFIQARRNHEE